MSSDANRRFPATVWSIVVHAKDPGSPEYFDAMNGLMCNYWRPVFFFLRARGYPTHRAEDLTQEFFLRLFDRNWIARADPQRGRFRTFLLTILVRFLSDQGPGRAPRQREFDDRVVSVSTLLSDNERSFDPPTSETPETVFMKQWATSTIEGVRLKLQAWCREQGRPDWYDVFNTFHFPESPSGPTSQESLARRFGLTRDKVRYALQETSQRFAELLRAEIADQVGHDEKAVNLELQELEDLLAG